MLIADTSAWIEFLIGSGSPQHARMRSAITDREVVVLEPILMEVLSGARRSSLGQVQRLMESHRLEPLVPRLDWVDGATIYRELRWRGVTLRSQVDALIAAVAIRLDLPVLHRDRDYDQIAAQTMLRVV